MIGVRDCLIKDTDCQAVCELYHFAHFKADFAIQVC